MSRLIDADLLKSDFNDVVPFDIVELPGVKIGLYRNSIIQQVIDEQPTVDAVEVVRCKDCIWYHKAHIKCNDGTEKDESEFPDEAFGILGRKCGVTIEYGTNVGGACENQRLFINDEYQFRKPEGYCSYGKRKGGAE